MYIEVDAPGIGKVLVHASPTRNVESFFGESIDFNRGNSNEPVVERLRGLPRHEAMGEWCSLALVAIDDSLEPRRDLKVYPKDEYEMYTLVREELERRIPGCFG